MASSDSLPSAYYLNDTMQDSQESREEPWASTSTLVNPDPPVNYIFDRNSVISATLYTRSGPAYRIITNSEVNRTELCDLTDHNIVATIKRRDFLPNLVVFAHRNGKSMKINKWLKRRRVAQGSQMTTVNDLVTPSGHFTWRSDDRHRLALYLENQTDFPIAYSKKLQDPPTLALCLRSCSDNDRIEIITSFIILEHRLRMKEKTLQGNTLYGVGSQFIMMR
ncbi:hypothetical protein JR316_0003533 [Psilocybe cubensis]|uniref:Uncharacterized protein n=2 Tax=Psilocybe cubensis TaxID=181762 RepID=A0ACB8H7U0_PSICU|nr:hypothetical protein JR316_0003533 [Psilocybe cubensis]KAH9484053.1 hypothetical protein JR316_0003533 [Psilocybe cubensis]